MSDSHNHDSMGERAGKHYLDQLRREVRQSMADADAGELLDLLDRLERHVGKMKHREYGARNN